ncbi:MAG: hypothetical protein SCARUB_02475 [Candidatus Scalindua rubra]|uniref:Prepilin-type N-terminal cleavage/methylation domain-containing protein n=1 Tax=Candidatus Scalindua rubra TaxID=1872076 RepID=A0A1E3X9X0_9BACT|nr:MAG: hypothetical protein SCARUB_02475 [Candidatus Scalindua rubra]
MHLRNKIDKTSMFQYLNTKPENSIIDNNQSSIFNRKSLAQTAERIAPRPRPSLRLGRPGRAKIVNPWPRPQSGSHQGGLKSQAGFTLIEIGIAIFILAIGLIGMLALFPIGVDSIKKVTQYSNAAILSELAISDLKTNDIVGIMGTLTAGQTYTYPDINNINQDKQFEDSSVNTVLARYSWQAIVKSINTTDTNLVRAQIAIFRNFNSSQFGTGTADFAASPSVSNVSAFPSGLTSKHYIRADNDKFWYRIDSIGTATTTIALEGPFLGNTGAGLAFSTTDDIIDIYETMFAKR